MQPQSKIVNVLQRLIYVHGGITIGFVFEAVEANHDKVKTAKTAGNEC